MILAWHPESRETIIRRNTHSYLKVFHYKLHRKKQKHWPGSRFIGLLKLKVLKCFQRKCEFTWWNTNKKVVSFDQCCCLQSITCVMIDLSMCRPFLPRLMCCFHVLFSSSNYPVQARCHFSARLICAARLRRLSCWQHAQPSSCHLIVSAE